MVPSRGKIKRQRSNRVKYPNLANQVFNLNKDLLSSLNSRPKDFKKLNLHFSCSRIQITFPNSSRAKYTKAAQTSKVGLNPKAFAELLLQ